MTKRIVHVIADLNIGGAELMLKRLVLSFINHPTYTHSVISLTGLGAVGAQLRNAGVDVHSLNMVSAASFPSAFWRLIRLLRTLKPAIVQTWMYHADFIGGFAGGLLGCKVIWGIRSTGIPQGPGALTWWLVRVNALTSYFIPHKIVCCANSAKQFHAALGFAARKLIFIPNGYDFSQAALNRVDRNFVRQSLGFSDADIVIGAVGRFDPLKDFQNFVKAAVLVVSVCPAARFLMVGRGLDANNKTLAAWVAAEGIQDKFVLVGEQPATAPYLSAMDVFCLSSRHEAFPNVVVEAMAAGLPCVVTDAGDASAVVGNCGLVVSTSDPGALGRGLMQFCQLAAAERNLIGKNAMQRVRAKYDIGFICSQYEILYDFLTLPKTEKTSLS